MKTIKRQRAKSAAKKKSAPRVLTINGGSSSIKFALFESDRKLRRVLEGKIGGIGLRQGTFKTKGADASDNFSRTVKVPNDDVAVNLLMDWLDQRIEKGALTAVGHRIVHGGPKYWEPQKITPSVIKELRRLSPFDPEHLPQQILLIEAFRHRSPELPQIACFDTAFHHDLPRVARLLPIPRRYEAKGIRRYGFHGLSCEYLMEELARVGGAKAAKGRVVLAHLGNGASITAVRGGRSMDTSMSFTPTAGLVMSTRSGDLDPSLAQYLASIEGMTAEQFHHMVNHESGLLGISEISPDMRELVALEKRDARAAEAAAVFCYQAKKFICAMAGAMGGLETLVFAGGIGENSPVVRERICRGLEFLGITVDKSRNKAGAAVISTRGSAATVRVIRTDEESVIAKAVCGILNL